MIRYTVYFNGEQVKSYDIEEPVIFIGRLPENHIPIFNMGISRRHVKIELDAYGAYTLTDLNSLNGTLVNGKKVKKAALVNGDKITIGKYTIVYEDLRGEAALHLETIVAEFKPEDMQNMARAAGLQMPPPYQPVQQTPQGMPPYQPPAQPPQMAPQPYQPPAQPPQMTPQPYQPPAQPPQMTPQPYQPPAQQPPQMAPQPYQPPTQQPPQTTPQPYQPPTQQPPQAETPAGEETFTGAVLIETTGHIVYKLDRSYLTIGSDGDDDIYASGFMVNRAFAVVEQRDGGFYITAQKMMAKVKVNGKGVRTHRLEHRDRIEIGSSTFRFMENG